MYFRSDASQNTFMTKTIVHDPRIEICLNFERKLRPDDLKMLYLISERCEDRLFLNLKSIELSKEFHKFENENLKTGN